MLVKIYLNEYISVSIQYKERGTGFQGYLRLLVCYHTFENSLYSFCGEYFGFFFPSFLCYIRPSMYQLILIRHVIYH